MTPKANLVVLLGGGLLAANVLFDPTFKDVRTSVSNGSASSSDLNTSPVHMVIVGLLTLVAVTVVASDNDAAANTLLIALVAFWLLWLMSYTKNKNAAATAAKTSTQQAQRTVK